MASQQTNLEVANASEFLEMVQRQSEAMRLELAQLRVEAAYAKAQSDDCHKRGAQLLEANQHLVVAAVEADANAVAISHELEEMEKLMRAGEREALRRMALKAHTEVSDLALENRQMQEAIQLKSQFISNMSHELRTPLNAIIGFNDLLQRGSVHPDSPKHQEFLSLVGNSARHLLRLINDVLDVSDIESGHFQLYPGPVDLRQLIAELGDVLHASMQRKAITFCIEIEPALTNVVIDPTRLKQVLYNLLSNAIKFTPDRGHVTVRASAEGPDHFRLEVQDTGIGIAEQDMPRLFVEFEQLHAGHAKPYPGTGMGLALTRLLVKAQGGIVGVTSTLGSGSVFHVVLPRVCVDP